MSDNDINLIGMWITDPKESKDNEILMLEFSKDGKLTYTILGEDSDKKIFLTYRIKNDSLITNQPSHPKEEVTKFHISLDGKLILNYEKNISKYIRYNPVTE